MSGLDVKSLTSFFVRRSVFFAFYGNSWTITKGATSKPSLPQQMDHSQAQEASDHREEDMNETSTSTGGRHDLAMMQYVSEQQALRRETLEHERPANAQLNQERQEQVRQELARKEQARHESLQQDWQEQETTKSSPETTSNP